MVSTWDPLVFIDVLDIEQRLEAAFGKAESISLSNLQLW